MYSFINEAISRRGKKEKAAKNKQKKQTNKQKNRKKIHAN